MKPFLFALFVVSVPALLSSCGDDSEQKPATLDTRSVFQLRNLAKLQAERDETEGYAEAARLLRKVLEKAPGDFEDHLNMARVLIFMEGGHTEAASMLEKARELRGSGDLPVAFDYIAGVVANRGRRWAEALAAFERVSAACPDHPQVIYQCGRALEQLNRHKEAEVWFRKLVDGGRLLQPSSYRLARVYLELGDREKMRAAQKLFKEQPKDRLWETEKCSFCRVRLYSDSRDMWEPAEVRLSWSDVTDSLVPEAENKDIVRAVPLRTGLPGARDLLLFGSVGARILRIADGKGAVREGALPETPPSPVRAAAVGDLGNDGIADIVLSSARGLAILDGREGDTFVVHQPALPPELGDVPLLDLRLFDTDHDGDLDIVGLDSKAKAAVCLRNNGDGTFLRQAPWSAELPRLKRGMRFDAHDLDQGNDIDLVFPGGEEGPVAALNLRENTYRLQALPGLGRREVILVEDFTNSGAPDVFGAGGEEGWSLLVNQDSLGTPFQTRFQAGAATPTFGSGEIHDACAADVDNDGDMDILLAAAKGLVVLRNRRGGVLREEAPIRLTDGLSAMTVDVADLTGNGRLEVLVGCGSGVLRVLAAEASPAYASLTLILEGRRDNKDCVGVVVETYLERQFQSVMRKRRGGFHLGLGSASTDALDGMFLRWPQGVRQAVRKDQMKLAPPGYLRLKQAEGLVASCPFLYGEGPDGWQYLTDVIGIAPLDEWLPDGQQPHLDPEEYVRVPGERLAVRQGRVRLAVTEELRETAYLDRMELTTIEHGEDVEVFNDESSRQGAYDDLQVFVVKKRDLLAPASVSVGGEDRLDTVVKQDRVYLHGYGSAPSQWFGWVPRYDIDLTLEKPATTLLLTGRIAWYDSTIVYSLAQHRRTWGPLRLQLLLPDGGVRTLIPDLGVPAGMDRTMVATFSEKPLPAGSRLRLSGQHRFLWDRIAFCAEVEPIVISSREGRHELRSGGALERSSSAPASGMLGYHGYSLVLGNRPAHEQTYDFDHPMPDDSFPRPSGLATRYGDVRELLLAHDDRLVTLAPGDKAEVTFAVPAEGRYPARTYFLKISGWAKEASYHNATGRSIVPLPFRAMKTYPPAPNDRNLDPGYLKYLETYQTRPILR